MQAIAVLHHVFLAFEPELAGLARAGLAVVRDVIGVGDRLGANEALFEICVNDACGLRRLRALFDGPRAGLFGADGEIRHQMQQRVTRADDAVEAGLFKANSFEVIRLLGGRQNSDLAFDLR